MLAFARQLLLELRRELFVLGALAFNTTLRMDRAPGCDQLAYVSQTAQRPLPVRSRMRTLVAAGPC